MAPSHTQANTQADGARRPGRAAAVVLFFGISSVCEGGWQVGHPTGLGLQLAGTVEVESLLLDIAEVELWPCSSGPSTVIEGPVVDLADPATAELLLPTGAWCAVELHVDQAVLVAHRGGQHLEVPELPLDAIVVTLPQTLSVDDSGPDVVQILLGSPTWLGGSWGTGGFVVLGQSDPLAVALADQLSEASMVALEE